jgi:preprotein translocase subunit SecF
MEFFSKVSNFPFMRTRHVWYGISAFAIVASLVLVFTRGLNLGIDFTGGVVVEMTFSEPVDLEKVRSTLASAGMPEAGVQAVGGDRNIAVRMLPDEAAGEKAAQGLRDKLLEAVKTIDPKVEVGSATELGKQVGEELFNQGGLALLFTFVGIMIYVAFRFNTIKLGTGAIVAAMHDPIIILGVFSLTGITFDLSAVAAILAVIGYSLNDTVVVFDRVRENFLTARKMTSEQVLNSAVNQTLSRTIITSGATFMVVLVLLLLGGESLKSFSAALTVGIIVGTYSSIYIAAAMALDMGITANDLVPAERDKEIDALP